MHRPVGAVEPEAISLGRLHHHSAVPAMGFHEGIAAIFASAGNAPSLSLRQTRGALVPVPGIDLPALGSDAVTAAFAVITTASAMGNRSNRRLRQEPKLCFVACWSRPRFADRGPLRPAKKSPGRGGTRHLLSSGVSKREFPFRRILSPNGGGETLHGRNPSDASHRDCSRIDHPIHISSWIAARHQTTNRRAGSLMAPGGMGCMSITARRMATWVKRR